MLTCSSCGTSYPVIDGIPRLIQQEFYWGEIDRSSAVQFVDDARQLGWRQAVAKRFTPDADASISILDWQRASWIPLLALPKNAVVLDVGSGYGALTHALAANYDEVHSVEAIPQRVEFTSLRMQQEAFTNVHLVQGSALRLPYAAGSFDGIVVNGVLEWIGDWDAEGDPRSAQLRFLRRIHALLKPGGVLLVGIENRIAYDAFAGAIDHSGLPFTNLLPRPLASVALRVFGKQHHRMEQPSRSYRTYTYSEAGYRKLFREAGFGGVDSYWAEPGYNQPYRLAPTDSKSVATSLREAQLEPVVADRVGTAGKVKRILARSGVLRLVVPEYVFIIRRDQHTRSPLQGLGPVVVDPDAQFRLTTAKFASKTTIRVASATQPGLVLHVSTLAPGSADTIAGEYAILERIAGVLGASAKVPSVAVPSPLGSMQVGNQRIAVQSLAPGKSFSLGLFERTPSERANFVETNLPSVSRAATALAGALAKLDGVQSSAQWVNAARALFDRETAARASAIAQLYSSTAHGDFTIENVFGQWDAEGQSSVTVIDWESAVQGVPQRYDLFSFYFSLLPAIVVPPAIASRFAEPLVGQAFVAFFDSGTWSDLLAKNFKSQAASSDSAGAAAWDLFMDSLILRSGYLAARGSRMAKSYAEIAAMARQHRSDFKL